MTNDNKRPAPSSTPPKNGPPDMGSLVKRMKLEDLFQPPGGKYKILERVPTSTLDDLKGMEETQKNIIRSVIQPFAHSEKAAQFHIAVPRGILLTGVPGTGKTALADAIVTEIRKTREVKYYQETGRCLQSLFGASEKNIRELFKTAKENAPTVIFLDELDGLGRGRGTDTHGAKHMILNTLLTEINNVVHGEILLIAATNCPELCDAALIRKGRFDMIIDLPRPSSSAREEIIQYYFGKKGIILSAPVSEEIAQRTDSCTGSDLKCLVDRIYQNAMDRVFPDGCWIDMDEEKFQEKQEALHQIDMEKDVKPALTELDEANGKQGIEKATGMYT